MTINAPVRDELLAEFENAWRDGAPVFGCCRKTVATALAGVDPVSLLAEDATTRVTALRAAVEADMPGHLDGHRCCVGHLADLAFDLPDMMGDRMASTA
ncbi:hypothetical protein [Euzebya tangerina]|uniref:hypothetical protein n=1 Tax=Euzebya tangerina TaxID=591198 RepID=UPI000E317A26|nr:hypothetical protein [Euzebya tangerina]